MIRLSKCSISQKEINSVVKTLKNEYLGMGTKVGVFEKNLKGFFGRDAICVSSGTAALQIAIQASNISFGDEVLVPAITYVATFQAISASGAIPIACEVNPETILIDLRDAEKKVTKRTKAIIPVHFAGNASNIKDVYLFAKKKNLIVIEDAAHAFGSYYKNKLVGSFGNISCFSFDGIKNITSGEGGCIISSNKQVNEKIRNARLLGVIGDYKNRLKKKRSWYFNVKHQGWRYHMSDIMASIGIEQLKRFSFFKKKRQMIAKLYDNYFKDQASIELLSINYNKVVPHIYAIKVINRKKEFLRKELMKINIETGFHYVPNHQLDFFKKYNKKKLPISESLAKSLVSLPLHVDLKKKDVRYIALNVIKILRDKTYSNL